MTRSTKEQLLGDFVHRVVSMPFAKPQSLVANNDGEKLVYTTTCEGPEGYEGETISYALDLALTLLWEAMDEVPNLLDERLRWKQPLETIVDPGGPWWPDDARIYRNLSASEQTWVRKRLEDNSIARV